jgi:hypothetical protein
MRLPTAIGEPLPRPGMSTDQAIFFWSDHSVGTSGDAIATPFRNGPRHQGQSESFNASKPGGDADAKHPRPVRQIKNAFRNVDNNGIFLRTPQGGNDQAGI